MDYKQFIKKVNSEQIQINNQDGYGMVDNFNASNKDNINIHNSEMNIKMLKGGNKQYKVNSSSEDVLKKQEF